MSALLSTSILFFTIFINQLEAARILAVLPTPSISHQVVFRPLTTELAKRGHEVVVITTDPAFEEGKTPSNFREIDVHNISYTKWAEIHKVTSEGNQILRFAKSVLELLNDIVEIQYDVPEIQRLVKEEKFDLLLIEACVRSALVYSHIFKVPVIQMSSFGFMDFNIDPIGAYWHPILYPSTFNHKLYHLTTLEKLEMLWEQYAIFGMAKYSEERENAIIKRIIGPNSPSIAELNNNIDIILLNIHPVWDDNRPVPPNVAYIWGIHEKPQKELPQDLKEYLDSSKNGVIYVSFGTNVKTSLLPKDKVQMYVNVLSKLPYNVLWKWDTGELPGRTENIRISSWLPQSDLLRHPNIKLFIMQGGLQSLGEAITGGVPLIGMPMLGDQYYNVEKIALHKIGLRLDIQTLQEDKIKNAVETVIQDPSYRRNIHRLRDIVGDEPMTPLNRAVWWTEYVLRHGGAKHLKSPTANISWTKFLELDLLLTVSLISIIILGGVIVLAYYFCQFLFKFVKRNIKMKKL